ncbi:MAG: hypothetical protein QW171_02340 [Candidatus Bilamarchaeaceae archaeon]
MAGPVYKSADKARRDLYSSHRRWAASLEPTPDVLQKAVLNRDLIPEMEKQAREYRSAIIEYFKNKEITEKQLVLELTKVDAVLQLVMAWNSLIPKAEKEKDLPTLFMIDFSIARANNWITEGCFELPKKDNCYRDEKENLLLPKNVIYRIRVMQSDTYMIHKKRISVEEGLRAYIACNLSSSYNAIEEDCKKYGIEFKSIEEIENDCIAAVKNGSYDRSNSLGK